MWQIKANSFSAETYGRNGKCVFDIIFFFLSTMYLLTKLISVCFGEPDSLHPVFQRNMKYGFLGGQARKPCEETQVLAIQNIECGENGSINIIKI